MRQIRREGMMSAFIAVLILWLASMTLVFSYRAQVRQFQHDYYQQCVSRLTYDKSSQDARKAFRAYYEANIEAERTNRFIDEQLRTERIRQDRNLIAALDDTLGKTVPGGCARYR